MGLEDFIDGRVCCKQTDKGQCLELASGVLLYGFRSLQVSVKTMLFSIERDG